MRTETLTDRSARLDLDGIDFEQFRSSPLDPATLRCLRYMHDVEGHTACYLRDLLVTRAHRDAAITAFLACWSYEEHWHGEAIARVLAAHGEPGGAARLVPLRSSLGWRDSIRPVLFAGLSAVCPQLPAVHMAWGAVNEWTTQAGYARLAARAGNPVLTLLLRRIMRQEGRHIDFYSGTARELLGASRVARRVTRAALQRFWGPVGSGVMPQAEVRFLATHLFGDRDGLEAAQRVDRQIDRLPGLSGLHLLEKAVSDLAPTARAGGPAALAA